MSGFKDAAHYLNTTSIDIPTNVVTDIGTGGVTVASTSLTLKEIICSLLAGNGLKLPNLQICLKVNIGRLLGLQGLPGALRSELLKMDQAMEEFIAHTNIDNVLARLNSVLAEITAISNMINFCGTPAQPITIPNLLRDVFGSFTGKGKDLVDKLGTMLDSDVGGCLGGSGFNVGVFQGGLLKDIGDLIDIDGNWIGSNADLDRITTELSSLNTDFKNLMRVENNFKGTTSSGGSVFTTEQRVHTDIGVAIPTDPSFAEAQRIASNLKAVYDSLNKYPVDDAGNNIFNYLLEPELIARLEADIDPTIPVSDRQPVYDYCGRITGYTESASSVEQRSTGAPVEIIEQPGVQGIQESGTVVSTSPSTTTNLSNTNPIVKTTVPTTPIGSSGDKKGDIRTDGGYIYIASADYDGQTQIWTRAQLNSW